MKYDAVIFEGICLADYADPMNQAIHLENLTLREIDGLTKIAHRNGLFICLIPREENG